MGTGTKPPKSPAMMAAERLRAALVQKLRSVGSDETLQQGILRAINLVEKFLGAHKEGDVNVLKRQVHAAIAAGSRAGAGTGTGTGMGTGRAGTGAGASSTYTATATTNFTTFGTTSRDGMGGRVGATVRAPDAASMLLSSTAPAGGARKSGGGGGGKNNAAAEVDWSLPPIWIDRKARLQHNRYVDMLRNRDERDLAEDARKKAEAKTAALAQRDYLDTQVAFQARLRRQNQEEIAKDRVAIEADLMALERETAAKAARQAAVIAKEKVARGAQVEANRERVARAAAQALADDKAKTEEARAEEAKKKAKAEAKKRELRKVQEDNVVRLRLKGEEMERARLRDMEMMAENERMGDEAARKRLAEIEAKKAKIVAMFEAAGGDALEAGMAEKAAADEQRMHTEIAMQDARDREKARVKRETAARLNAECMGSVEQQLARRREAAERERARKAEMSRALVRDVADLKKKEKVIKEKAEERKRAVRDGIVAQMRADATRRFIAGKDDMPEHEVKFNGFSLKA